MIVILITILVLLCVLLLLTGQNNEKFWENYIMPTGIPKTYISTHFILNQSCAQNATVRDEPNDTFDR